MKNPYKLVQELIFLQRHAKNTLKILISSRYQKRIAQLLKEVGTIQLSQDKTKADLDRYIRQAVERAVHDGWIEIICSKIQEEIETAKAKSH